MAGKLIKFGFSAHSEIKNGLNKLADAVGCTMGPSGRTVTFKENWGVSRVTKDGITVAKSISFKNQFEDIGAQFARAAAQKTVDEAGDGTTSATILTQAIYNESLLLLAAGYNPINLKRGIDKAVKAIVEMLNDFAIPTQDRDKIEQVANISSNDKEIGKLVADAIEKVGRDGVITIEQSKNNDTYLDITDGMRFDRGFYSPYFISDADRVECELNDCFILFNDGRLEDVSVLLPLLQEVSKMGKPLLIIAEDFGQTLLSTLITNKVRGSLLSCPVKSPGFGERRKEILKDMAVLTNGKVFSNEAGLKLEQAEIEHLGRADKIIVNRGSTTIVGGAGSKEEIQKRLTQIKDDIKNLTDDYSGYDAERMRERIGKLSGGIGVIRVGAPTETEMKEKKDRVEDALHATRAAVEEGIVPGGGVALLRCIPAVKDLLKDINDIGEREGIRIILNAIETPLKTIVKNAGHKPDVVLEKVLANNDNLFYGYNAATNTYEDLVESGIIDPKKVVRCALQNAASIASMLITTEAVVVDDPDEEKKIDD